MKMLAFSAKRGPYIHSHAPAVPFHTHRHWNNTLRNNLLPNSLHDTRPRTNPLTKYQQPTTHGHHGLWTEGRQLPLAFPSYIPKEILQPPSCMESWGRPSQQSFLPSEVAKVSCQNQQPRSAPAPRPSSKRLEGGQLPLAFPSYVPKDL